MFGSGGRYLECLASLKRFGLGKDFAPKRRIGCTVLPRCTRERQGLLWRETTLSLYENVNDFFVLLQIVVTLRERRIFLFSRDNIVAMYWRERQGFSWRQITLPLCTRPQQGISWREIALFLNGRWRRCRGEGEGGMTCS